MLTNMKQQKYYFYIIHTLCLKQILEEADLDNDRMLSLAEFEHAMIKSPDFLQ